MAIFPLGGFKIDRNILYFGPSRSGKSTNLADRSGNIPDREPQTMFVPKALNIRYRLSLYTALTKARNPIPFGGVVFVADSARGQLENNRESLLALGNLLQAEGLDIARVPVVLQYNKRDLPDAASLDEMDASLRGVWPFEWPRIEAIATQRVGVVETIQTLAEMIEPSTNQMEWVRVP